jgi:tRNA (cytidine/uridine-2'-O-)-methyltransferase
VIHVVLFEPEIPPNTGNAIRLCANTGATLHLVKPLGFQLDNKSLQRSGLDYHDLADVRVHGDFGACLADLGAARVFAVETGSARRYSEVAYREGDAFVFGPETRGLPAAVWSASGARIRCSFRCALRVAASIYPMRWPSSCTTPGGNWDSLGARSRGRLGGALPAAPTYPGRAPGARQAHRVDVRDYASGVAFGGKSNSARSSGRVRASSSQLRN